MWAWGSNNLGQLGNGTTTNSTDFIRIGTDSDWIAVSAGMLHSLALKADGSLWAWGSNYYGQLGDNTTTDRDIPTRVGADNDWTIIASGSTHSFAIKDDGSLWAWGYNVGDVLGLGTTGENKLVPIRVGLGNDWAAVTSGVLHSAAIKEDGSLWTWGSNNQSQLGNGTSTGLHHTIPTKIPPDEDWTAVKTGAYSTIAQKIDGSFWAWGGNSSGQLGVGDDPVYNTPTPIGQDDDWIAISVGASRSMAIKDDGSVWGWGSNDSGLLGDGTTTSSSVPVLIFSGD